jgi:hypothetical protein
MFVPNHLLIILIRVFEIRDVTHFSNQAEIQSGFVLCFKRGAEPFRSLRFLNQTSPKLIIAVFNQAHRGSNLITSERNPLIWSCTFIAICTWSQQFVLLFPARVRLLPIDDQSTSDLGDAGLLR